MKWVVNTKVVTLAKVGEQRGVDMYSRQRRTATYGVFKRGTKNPKVPRRRAGVGSFVFIHRTVSGHRKKRQGAVESGRSPWKSSAVVGDIQLFSASKALALAHCTIAMMRKSLISRCQLR